VAAGAPQAGRAGADQRGGDLLPESEMAMELDGHVEEFRTRRLDDVGPFTFVVADAGVCP